MLLYIAVEYYGGCIAIHRRRILGGDVAIHRRRILGGDVAIPSP